jgi:hypothetical protein
VTHGRTETLSHASGSPIFDTTAGDLCGRQLPACSQAVLRL